VALIPYLVSGERPTAARMNALFDALDAKLSNLLTGKSFLFCDDAGFFLSRKRFCFFSGLSAYARRFAAHSYNHQLFVDAADGLAELTQAEMDSIPIPGTPRDSELRIVHTKAPLESAHAGTDVPFNGSPGSYSSFNFLDFSLEAHTREIAGERYWLQPWNSRIPEKIYRYALADIIIEGPTSLTITRRQNKFNFFRFHNMTKNPVTISFDGDLSFTLPRWESVCYRRTGVGGIYTRGGRYFQKFLPDDPRLFQFNIQETGTTSPVKWAMAANNVSNPKLLFDFVNQFAGPMLGAEWTFDNAMVHDVHSDYADLFGDPSDPATLIGDLIHHKGKLKIARKAGDAATTFAEVEFKGYRTLMNDFAAKNLNVTETNKVLSIVNGDGIQTDLVSWSTNLLGNVPVTNVNAPVQLASFAPLHWHNSDLVTAQAFAGENVVTWQEVQADHTNGFFISFNEPTYPQIRTVEEFTTFNSANLTAGRYTNQKLTLTGAGLVLTYDRTVTGKYPIQDFNDSWEIGNKEITKKEFVAFNFNGFPEIGEIIPKGNEAYFGLLFTLQHGIVAGSSFHSPRKGRFPASFTPYNVESGGLAYRNPWFKQDKAGPDGADFSLNRIHEAENGIKLLQRVEALLDPEEDGRFFSFAEPDVLNLFADRYNTVGWYDELTPVNRRALLLANQFAPLDPKRFTRLPLLREHYNNMAWSVNRIKGGYPLHFGRLSFVLPSEPESLFEFVAASLGNIGLEEAGLIGLGIHPRYQFAELRYPRNRECATVLGIPIKTYADFPASWQQAQTLAFDVLKMNGIVKPSFPQPQYYWCDIRDVKARAEELGWLFVHEKLEVAAGVSIDRHRDEGDVQTILEIKATHAHLPDFEFVSEIPGNPPQMWNFRSDSYDTEVADLAQGSLAFQQFLSTAVQRFQKFLLTPAPGFSNPKKEQQPATVIWHAPDPEKAATVSSQGVVTMFTLADFAPQKIFNVYHNPRPYIAQV